MWRKDEGNKGTEETDYPPICYWQRFGRKVSA